MRMQSIKILLVEDNPGDARLIQEYLKGDGEENFLIVHSNTLEIALGELSRSMAELILLDLGLPDSQGLDTFHKIHACAPQLPLVVLSGLNDTNVAIAAVQAGAQDFLTKDEITPGLLQRTLRYALERKRVEETLRRKNQYMTALQETTFELVSQLDLDALLENIVRRSAQLLGTSSGFLDLLDPETNQLIPKIGLGALAEALRLPVIPGKGLAGIVWQTGQPMMVQDYDAWPGREEGYPYGSISAILGVPLLANRRILGVLGLACEYGSNQTFAEDALEFITQFAHLAAIAIGNALLYSASQRELAERKQTEQALEQQQYLMSLLMDTIPDLIYFKDSQSRFIRINQAEARHLGIEAPEQAVEKSDFDYFIPEFARIAFANEKEILKTGQGLVNHEEMTIFPDRPPQWLSTTKMPLRNQQGEILGTFGISRDISKQKQAESALLGRSEELRRSNLELARLYRASGSLIASEPFDLLGLAQAIVETVLKEFDITNCCLHIAKNNSPELVRLAYAGKVPDQTPEVMLRLDGPGLIPLAMRSAQLVNVSDVCASPDYVDVYGETRSEMVVPLMVNERVMGALNLESERVANFSSEDEKLLRTFGHQAAVVLENTRLMAETNMQILRLKSLRRIDETINASLDLSVTTSILLEQIMGQLNVDAADILIYNPFTKSLKYINGRGFNTAALQHTDLRLGQGLAGRAAYDREIVHVSDLDSRSEFFQIAPLMPEEHFVEYYGVPLISKGSVKGLLEIFNRSPLRADETWLDFLETLAGQTAIAIDNIQMFEDLQRSNNELTLAYDATIEGWSRTLDLRDKETEGHSQRVTEITLRLAKASGIQGEELVHIRRGALLHDIGKMGISDSILLKPGPLNDVEWTTMRRHPQYAYELLSPIAFLKPALEIPYCHHEKWDGSGYPRGLEGEQIPLPARLFAIADIWDALTSNRPYRAAWTESKAVEFIREQAGKHLDPRLVELFFNHYLSEPEAQARATILIVDDEENVTRSLARSLQDQFTVLTAFSGEEALRILDQSDPAVVLTDQRMPGMSGVELLERIRIMKPNTVGILISGYSDVVALTAAINLSNVRGFIPKPWDLERLREKLDEAIVQYRGMTRET